ncbi:MULTISPECIES: N-acetylmuramoyl-L-alanine amidase [unclassified Fusobacterium]|uniref:N-acetylmuramoyl-L-alanine amidase n=1 Tax=unclassified Fusobacterium TaxID=2648384 RepID=UPI001B8D305E|nr:MULTISPECIES: N-acetylmuramoyl-L-alanine amidase [unclassified Fusobacterium]MBR8701488.1 hypothetical protein [Fusobacterium sp. DD45]MBR8711733.1 hypothetical protein [Fusobacterium sp. DD28]MBR8752278.1 hypothetical protein [Fusobacterium sp. DD26]
MEKVALVVGHNERSKGAYSTVLNESEFDYYKEIATLINQMDESIDIYIRKPNTSYTREMSQVINSINLHTYKYVFELHFNNVTDSKVNGALCLAYHNSTKGLSIAKEFLERLCKEYNLKNKGIVKIKSSNERGGFGICKTNCPYVLIEPFFGNNMEANKFVDKEKFANFLLKFIQEV